MHWSLTAAWLNTHLIYIPVTSSLHWLIDRVPAEGTMFESPAFKLFDFLFGIPLIHDIMFGVYRKQIVEKAGEKRHRIPLT